MRHVAGVASRIDDVFEDNAVLFLGMSFEAIGLASVIQHRPTSDQMRLAEEAIATGRYFDGLSHLSAAFQLFIDHFRRFGIPEDAARNMRAPRDLIDGDEVKRWLFSDPNQQRVLTNINREWAGAMEQLELAKLGVSLAEYSTFTYLAPKASLNDFGDVIHSGSREPGGALRYNNANAQLCLNFVWQTVTRLQVVTRVLDLEGYFDIRLVTGAPFYRNAAHEPAGELPAGHEIHGATLALATGPVEECFLWTEGTDRLHVDIAHCEVSRVIQRGEYWEAKHKADALAARGKDPKVKNTL
jgi:hypothetical protein